MADHNRTASRRASLVSSSSSSFSSSSGLSSGEIAARVRRAASSRKMRLRSQSEAISKSPDNMITKVKVSTPVRKLWSRQTIGSQPKTKTMFTLSHTKSGSNIVPQVKGFPFKVTYKIRLVCIFQYIASVHTAIIPPQNVPHPTLCRRASVFKRQTVKANDNLMPTWKPNYKKENILV